MKLRLPDALTFLLKYKPGVRLRNICREVSQIYSLASAEAAKLTASLTVHAGFSPWKCGQRLTADLLLRLKTNHPRNLAGWASLLQTAEAAHRDTHTSCSKSHTNKHEGVEEDLSFWLWHRQSMRAAN